jgi:hypothetical protein
MQGQPLTGYFILFLNAFALLKPEMDFYFRVLLPLFAPVFHTG